MTKISFVIAALCCLSSVSALDADIDELSLNFNQIKRLIASFSNENLLKAVKFALDTTERSKFQENRISMKAKIQNGSISHAQLIESLPDEDAKSIDFVAQEILKASSYLLNMYCKSSGVSNKDCVKFMSKYSLPETSRLANRCLAMSHHSQAYRRLLPASYRDGLDKIRASASGKDLPLPRVISNVLFTSGLENISRRNENKVKPAVTEEGVIDGKLSLSVAQWTQFVEHDLSRTVSRSMLSGTPIECCDQESVPIQPRYLHQSCQPLLIPSDDPHYRSLRVTCLNYVRSAIAINEQCRFGSINQLNKASNLLDLSQLYGNDDDDQDKIRSFHQGSLLASADDASILPKSFDELCFADNENSTCYHSADSRVNANPFVTIMYTIFLRSHNQISQKLKQMNPRWDDNRLFSVAKDINIAIYQKFVYNDWANVVLGKRTAMDLRNVEGKHYKSVKVSNEFGAAVRFYNTMLPGDLLSHQDEPSRMLSRSSENIIEATDVTSSKRKELLKLQDSFYKPRDLGKHNMLDQLMNSILRQRSMAMDSSYVDDLSLQFYRARMFDNKIFGGDSLAFDIQRSRDHGLQPYINYIKKCLNIRITSWDDLRNIIAVDELNKLKSIYDSVQDIDLIVGGLSETPIDNATLGPTFSCILSDQLISSRVSDKNFYTRPSTDDGEKVAKTVEKYSAARFICDNTKLKKVQRNIFHVPSTENPLIDCSEFEQLPKLDLSYWLVIQS